MRFFSQGAAAWSGCDAKLEFASTNYDVECYVVSEPNAKWDGQCVIGKDAIAIRSASIKVNSAITQTYNNADALKSVVVHEFGHVFGLGENPNSSAIMNPLTWNKDSDLGRWEKYKLTTPQTDDKNGVNAIY